MHPTLRLTSGLLLLGGLLIGTGFAPITAAAPAAPATPSATNAARERALAEIRKADRDFSAATFARRLAGFREFLAADVHTIRPDTTILRGPESLVDVWSWLRDSTLAIRWEPVSASMAKGVDLGYTIGRYELLATDTTGTHVVGSGQYVTIWRRQANGSWKVEFDTGTPDKRPRSISSP